MVDIASEHSRASSPREKVYAEAPLCTSLIYYPNLLCIKNSMLNNVHWQKFVFSYNKILKSFSPFGYKNNPIWLKDNKIQDANLFDAAPSLVRLIRKC